VGLLVFSDAHIIDTYQRRFRGLAEYYKYAVDRSKLGRLKHVMEQALTKTLGEKYKLSVKRVYRKYNGTQTVNGQTYKTLQVTVTTTQADHVFCWGAIPLKTVKPGTDTLTDVRPHDRRYEYSDVVRRLQANRCELCGWEGQCEVHHVRKLADLKQRWRGRKEKPPWVKRMIALRRKTLIVCHACHVDIHAGRSTPKQRKTRSGEPDDANVSRPVRRGG
jgi:hypothetical protein